MKHLTEISKLHPWPVIKSFLAEIPTSEQYRTVVERSGLSVDWTLEGNEDYSNSTRIRAYRSRVDAALIFVSEEDILRVSAIIAYALSRQEVLELIGWTFKGGRLTTINSSVIDVFFPKGAVHDAYVEIRHLLLAAKASLDIVDPYSDSTIFQMLAASTAPRLTVRILTTKTPPDLAVEAKKFVDQHLGWNVQIRTTSDFHDRFIIRDEKDYFHLGHSIKDFGSKSCMLNQILDEINYTVLKNQIEKSWKSATSL